jgi:hypothetical protein
MGVYEETPTKKIKEKWWADGLLEKNVYRHFGTLLSTNVEHLATISSAIWI